MTAVLDKPQTRTLAALAASAVADYRRAVFATARSEPVEQLRQVLSDAGRGLPEFQRHVELAKRRLDAAEELRQAENERKQMDVLADKMRELEKEIEKVFVERNAQLKALRNECDRIGSERINVKSERDRRLHFAHQGLMATASKSAQQENAWRDPERVEFD